ncbi:MAG: hypothetical protein ACI8VT_000370 [Saprospiraceae bacterium]|jgi:hypothetical protein
MTFTNGYGNKYTSCYTEAKVLWVFYSFSPLKKYKLV